MIWTYKIKWPLRNHSSGGTIHGKDRKTDIECTRGRFAKTLALAMEVLAKTLALAMEVLAKTLALAMEVLAKTPALANGGARKDPSACHGGSHKDPGACHGGSHKDPGACHGGARKDPGACHGGSHKDPGACHGGARKDPGACHGGARTNERVPLNGSIRVIQTAVIHEHVNKSGHTVGLIINGDTNNEISKRINWNLRSWQSSDEPDETGWTHGQNETGWTHGQNETGWTHGQNERSETKKMRKTTAKMGVLFEEGLDDS